MKSTTTFLSAVFFTTLFLMGACVQTQAQRANTLEDDLNMKLSEIADKYNLQGLAASVMFSDGSIWSGVESPTDNLSTDMLFEMGSNTKTFTTAMILQMAEEGKLTLSDTLGMFFGEIEHVDMGVTVKQLLNHTSGIYSYTDNPDFSTAIGQNALRVFQPIELLDLFLKSMRFEPGTDWRYSNTNYVLLGLIIEHIDESKYEESLRTRILEPLELEHSYLDIFESYDEPRSGTWLSNGTYLNEPYPAFMSAAWAAGGLVSTTEDLALWAHKLYTNEVLSEAWTDSMKKLTVVDGKEKSYGLGMFYRTYKGTPLYGHGGTTLQHSTMEYSSEYDFSLVMVINEQTRGSASGPAQNEMLDYLLSKPWGLSTDETANINTRVYPNPATNELYLNTTITSGQLTLLNLTGSTVLQQQFDTNTRVGIEHLQEGVYMVIVQDASGAGVYQERVVILKE